jgi:hypothetical protein
MPLGKNTRRKVPGQEQKDEEPTPIEMNVDAKDTANPNSPPHFDLLVSQASTGPVVFRSSPGSKPVRFRYSGQCVVACLEDEEQETGQNE